MKYLYIYICLILLIIGVSLSFFYEEGLTWEEGFSGIPRNFILMGDSVLNNSLYVPSGNTVADFLALQENITVTNLAKNDAVISDVYNQLSDLKNPTSTDNRTIFLSVGGNDILYAIESVEVNRKSNVNSLILEPIFAEYKTLVETIIKMTPMSKLVIMDIYYPRNRENEPHYRIIKEWNNMLYSYSTSNSMNKVELFKISNLLTEPEDFTKNIEPSVIGGKKLAEGMTKYY